MPYVFTGEKKQQTIYVLFLFRFDPLVSREISFCTQIGSYFNLKFLSCLFSIFSNVFLHFCEKQQKTMKNYLSQEQSFFWHLLSMKY